MSELNLQDVRHADLSPEMMELMGKQAANLFMEKGVALNESISKLAAAHEDINQEQIKRICEFANTATYLAQHDKNKTAGASVSYPEFDLADPNRVIQDLSDGAKPTVITKVDTDYGKLPAKKSKVSAARSDELLAELFQVKEASARADLDFSGDTAVDQVMTAKSNLVALKDSLSNSLEQLDLMKKEAEAEFYDQAKRHVLDGGPFMDVYKAVEAINAPPAARAEVMTPVIMGFAKEKVSSIDKMKTEMKSLEKVAHRVINPEHPMVKSAGAIIDCSQQIDVINNALPEVEAQLEKVNSFLKENFRAGSPR